LDEFRSIVAFFHLYLTRTGQFLKTEPQLADEAGPLCPEAVHYLSRTHLKYSSITEAERHAGGEQIAWRRASSLAEVEDNAGQEKERKSLELMIECKSRDQERAAVAKQRHLTARRKLGEVETDE
jgi:predicted metal-dependent hydrolase